MTDAELVESKRTYWRTREIDYDNEREFIDGTEQERGWREWLADRDAPQFVPVGDSADFPSSATDDDIPF